MDQTLLKPLITERTMQEAALGRFTFLVDLASNKPQITQAVAKMFNVHPNKVQTLIVKGKTKRSPRTRKFSQEPDVKKAIVTLKSGEKIDLFDIGGHLTPVSF